MNEFLFTYIKDKIPNHSLEFMRGKLQEISERQCDELILLRLKNPSLCLLLSLCFGFFGVDRFYKGNVILAICKILLFWGSAFAMTLVAAFEVNTFFVLLFGVSFFCALVWGIADIFLCFFGIKQDNLAKILAVLT